MKTRYLLAAVVLFGVPPLVGQVPRIINYQGKIQVGDTPFTGTGQFRFALVDAGGTASYWSNDGTSTGGGEPTASVPLPVAGGIFIAPLGDTSLANMTEIPLAAFGHADVRVRVWFDDGSAGSQLLAPDQRLTAVGYSMVAASVQAPGSHAAPAPENAGTVYFNTTDRRLYYSDGVGWVPAGASKAVYRWAVWHNYEQGLTWYFNNNSALTGGVNPSNWTDGNATAGQISSDKKVQAALFNKKAAVSPDSLVWAEQYLAYSSTDAKMAAALFRVCNTTGENIQWTLQFHATANGNWSERASVTINGLNIWNSGISNDGTAVARSVTVTVPPNRVSTVICVAGSGPPTSVGSSGIYSRACALAFYNQCLTLPVGLEFVDDLDTAPSGWDY